MLAQSLVNAVKDIREALNRAETLDDATVYESAYACLRFDQVFTSTCGSELLLKLADTYPQWPFFSLAKIRCLLNSGRHQDALRFVEEKFGIDPEIAFAEAEKAVASILEISPSLKEENL